MAKAQKITTVVLDPDIWARGVTGPSVTNTLLFTHDGKRKQCCIGVACTAFGIDDEYIINAACPENISEMWGSDVDLPSPLRRLAELTEERVEVYRLNDRRDSPDNVRVRRINADLKKHKIALRFRLKKSRAVIGSGNQAADGHSAIPRRSEAP